MIRTGQTVHQMKVLHPKQNVRVLSETSEGHRS